MNIENRNIGRKIKSLRKTAGYSQEELAKLIDIKRPVLSNMENGERKITAEDIKKLSKVFNVSSDVLLGLQKEPEVFIEKKTVKRTEEKPRINVPQKNLEKFKQVLLYILNQVGSKPNIGETVIYKLLYFIDFDFYEIYEEQLIGATYIKNHYGPTPIEFKKIVDDMIEEKEIIKVKDKYFDYERTKYLPLKKPDLSKLKANEVKVIDDVLNKLSEMNAKEISDYSHQDIPWVYTEVNQPIEYEAVFYRNFPYINRRL